MLREFPLSNHMFLLPRASDSCSFLLIYFFFSGSASKEEVTLAGFPSCSLLSSGNRETNSNQSMSVRFSELATRNEPKDDLLLGFGLGHSVHLYE